MLCHWHLSYTTGRRGISSQFYRRQDVLLWPYDTVMRSTILTTASYVILRRCAKNIMKKGSKRLLFRVNTRGMWRTEPIAKTSYPISLINGRACKFNAFGLKWAAQRLCSFFTRRSRIGCRWTRCDLFQAAKGLPTVFDFTAFHDRHLISIHVLWLFPLLLLIIIVISQAPRGEDWGLGQQAVLHFYILLIRVLQWVVLLHNYCLLVNCRELPLL